MKKNFKEFKEFISKGNIIDMAVGVIIGGAFGNIVSSLVNDIIMPFVGLIIGGINFKNLSINVGEVVINYGTFIQNVTDFLIIAACIFTFIKIINRFKKPKEEPTPKPVVKPDEVVLLEEIRDLLKKKK